MYFLLFLFSNLVLAADQPPATEWRALYYERDLKTNTLKGRGNAYYKQGNQEVWADEIEVNLNTNWVYANGNAHFYDGTNDIFCDRASYALNGNEAILEEATLVTGKMVIAGAQIRKMTKDHYEMDEGVYTNCNTNAIRDKTAANCAFDWKIYGKHFSVTIEGYAHIYDAIIYAKELPVLYFPYYLAPAKSKRQTGFLNVKLLTGPRNVGSAVGMPFFWALSSWQDVTIDPMYYSKAGLHTGINYNYSYSRSKEGHANLYSTQLRYRKGFADRGKPTVAGRPTTPNWGEKNGFLGEWAVDIHNRYSLGERAFTKQTFTMVSDPYYPLDYPTDLGALAEKSALRSQIFVTSPYDNYLATAALVHYQNLVMPSDTGVDKGPVTQLPALGFYQKSRPSPLNFISYEVDTKFTNFYRANGPFDVVPNDRDQTKPLPTRTNFAGRDYVRAGQRLLVEPRAIINVPLATGFQFQPTVKAGTLLYHFDVPNSQGAGQGYLDAEVPFSMYLAKNFRTSISGMEKVRHVFQPKVMYAVALARTAPPSHPFFASYSLLRPYEFSNPRFDITDQLTNFEYIQIELNNRFLRSSGTSFQKFFFLSLKNQLNSRRSDSDPRYRTKLGPVSVLMEFNLAPINAQIQGDYGLEKVGSTHESTWTGSVTYGGETLSFALSGILKVQDNPRNNEHKYNIGFSKALPVFVNLEGGVEYNVLTKRVGTYSFGLKFASKPVSCWYLNVAYGHNVNTGETGAEFKFGFDFGGPATMSSGGVGM